MRALLRLCLVLSTWNAPLPMIHAHEVHPSTESKESMALLKHVQEFHEDAELAGESYLGWHIHWLLPSEWQSYPCQHPIPAGSGTDSHDRDHTTLTGGPAVPAKTATQSPARDTGKPIWLSQQVQVVVSQAPISRQAGLCGFIPLNFLASFGRSASLCQLLSAWNC